MLGATRPEARPPLYQQVATVLRTEIEQRMRPGEAIATETELETRFGVSRITIRRAIDLLERAGLVYRRQGSGTFVTRPRVTEELGVLHSWTEGMRAQGLEPRTVHCAILTISAPEWVAGALRLDAAQGEPVLRIERLRYAGDEPLCLMVDYVRSRFVPGLAEAGLKTESLYETLATTYGLELARADDTVTAREADVVEASLLRLPARAPVLHVTRVTYLPGDEPLGAATVVSVATRYAYRVSGRPRAAPRRAG
jgi:GntR family transcriptional regulator